MKEAITAGGLIFCFGRRFHCFLALGKNNITFVLMDPLLQTVCGKMMRSFRQLIEEV